MTPTPAEARASLVALLDTSPLDGVDSVYGYEPHNEATGPVYVTVELDRIAATEQVWAVRIYSQAADCGQADAAAALDVALAVVDDCLKGQTFGPSEWQVAWDEPLLSLVARLFVDVPRESF